MRPSFKSVAIGKKERYIHGAVVCCIFRFSHSWVCGFGVSSTENPEF